MGAAAAAIIIRKERDLVAHFVQAGAISASTAQTSMALGVDERLAWERLVARAVIRQGTPGSWYLDLPSWEAMNRLRRRKMSMLLVVILLALVAVGLSRIV